MLELALVLELELTLALALELELVLELELELVLELELEQGVVGTLWYGGSGQVKWLPDWWQGASQMIDWCGSGGKSNDCPMW